MRVLLVRAGALGDVLLLRQAVFALRQSKFEVSLLAPERPAAALLGPGPSEVDEVLPWEGVDVAALLAGNPPPKLVDSLRAYKRVVAYTRNDDVLAALKAVGANVHAQDPMPPAGRWAADWLIEPIRDLVSPDSKTPPSVVPTESERLEAK